VGLVVHLQAQAGASQYHERGCEENQGTDASYFDDRAPPHRRYRGMLWFGLRGAASDFVLVLKSSCQSPGCNVAMGPRCLQTNPPAAFANPASHAPYAWHSVSSPSRGIGTWHPSDVMAGRIGKTVYQPLLPSARV